MWMSQRLSPASSGSLVGVHAGRNLIVNLWSVPILGSTPTITCALDGEGEQRRRNRATDRQGDEPGQSAALEFSARRGSGNAESYSSILRRRMAPKKDYHRFWVPLPTGAPAILT